MNKEHDRELDILLRRQAKSEHNRKTIAMSFNEENGKEAFGFEISEHLDADAMNAYAENALPQPTRVRYTEHLISCDACRQLVTQLALSANSIGFEKKEGVGVEALSPLKRWGEWFKSLFTLPKLKVAGPIAAVLCFAAITFVAWQRSDLKDSTLSHVKERKENASHNLSVEVNPSAENRNGVPTQTSKTNANAPASNKDAAGPDNKSNPSSKSGAPEEKMNDETTPAPKTEVRTDNPKAPERDKAKSADGQSAPIVSQQPSGPAIANQTQNTVQESGQRQTAPRKGPSRSNQEANVNRDSSNQAENTALGGTNVQKPDETQAKDSNRKEAKKTSPPPSPAKKQTAVSDDDDEKLAKSESAANTRSVDGKQFMQKGNAWVDKDYKGSSTTNIKRGTEEYNALDSGLRSICEKLGGEVIVVWKSKAYKIN